MLLEVKVFQTYDNQQCVNTFNYIGIGTPAAVTSSFALTAAMGFINGVTPDIGDIYGTWKNFVNLGVLFTEVQVKDVYSDTDFYTLPLIPPNLGIQGDEPMASFNAFAFQTNRVRADVRRGNKRFVGVGEGNTDGYGVIEPSFLTSMQSFGTELSNILTYDDEGNQLSFTPVVVSKESYAPSAGRTAYRYYATESEQLNHTAVGVAWTPKAAITTQVSRKRGRGI